MKIRLPNRSHRTTIVGRTGSGKTVAMLWHLTNYPLDKFPFVIFNFKNDENINSIEGATHIEDLEYVPKRKDAGLFILHPSLTDANRPKADEHSPLEKYCFKIWERRNCGIGCDEAFVLGRNDGYDTCLVQGRSLRIPVITASQRPAWVTRFAFSEAEFIQVFDLVDDDDKKRVKQFCPINYKEQEELGEHQSFYYDVGKKQLTRWNPVPDMDEIRARFERLLKPKQRKWL